MTSPLGIRCGLDESDLNAPSGRERRLGVRSLRVGSPLRVRRSGVAGARSYLFRGLVAPEHADAFEAARNRWRTRGPTQAPPGSHCRRR